VAARSRPERTRGKPSIRSRTGTETRPLASEDYLTPGGSMSRRLLPERGQPVTSHGVSSARRPRSGGVCSSCSRRPTSIRAVRASAAPVLSVRRLSRSPPLDSGQFLAVGKSLVVRVQLRYPGLRSRAFGRWSDFRPRSFDPEPVIDELAIDVGVAKLADPESLSTGASAVVRRAA